MLIYPDISALYRRFWPIPTWVHAYFHAYFSANSNLVHAYKRHAYKKKNMYYMFSKDQHIQVKIFAFSNELSPSNLIKCEYKLKFESNESIISPFLSNRKL